MNVFIATVWVLTEFYQFGIVNTYMLGKTFSRRHFEIDWAMTRETNVIYDMYAPS